MDEKVVKKIIEINQESPTFKYKNPLLDIDVAKKVANTFVNILNGPEFNEHLRQEVVKSVLKVCTNVIENHLPITDNIAEIIMDSFEDFAQAQYLNNNAEILDTFLIRNLKEVYITSVHRPLVSQEVIKAVANLKNLPDPEIKSMNHDDISIKYKPEIEKVLLKYSCEILTTVTVENTEHWLCNENEFKSLTEKCSRSNEYFQICCSILNAIFIKTGFKSQILDLTNLFITFVKQDFICNCNMIYFSHLYPNNLRHIVTLLDIDFDTLPLDIKDSYISFAIEQLRMACNEDINDVVMLLSHYQQWFNIYYHYYHDQ